MSQPFHEQRRQIFLTEDYYNAAVSNFNEITPELIGYYNGPNGDLEDKRGWAFYIAEDTYTLFTLRYTAGAPMEELREELTGVIEAYERFQKALALYEQIPEIAPLGMGRISDYERVMQLIGLSYLLNRPDLLPRIAALQDPGFFGDDALYEDLLCYALPGRFETNDMLHIETYDPLLAVMYEDSAEASTKLMNQYLENWYPAFEQAPWHDGHLRIEGTTGDYFGYWAFEAGAVALLSDIDDSSITHMVYPRDMVEWARANGSWPVVNAPALPPVRSARPGEPCPETGEWFANHLDGKTVHLKKGETMPGPERSATGEVIWYLKDRPL